MCVVNLAFLGTSKVNYIIDPLHSSVLGIGAPQRIIIPDKNSPKG